MRQYVVLKPSEQVPLTPQIAFLPPGGLSIANGGREVVEGILHPRHRHTSARRRWHASSMSAARQPASVQAVCDAKNYIVVMPDAVIAPTVKAVIGSALGAASRRCMAAQLS
jgi:malonate-semialdehyde dehydrogenase (acetylating) / methylmalonate-semialdehyde dehydrogenase